MRKIAANKFFSNPQKSLKPVIEGHAALRVTREDGKAFVVVDAEDWDREQETLYILQNKSLAKQIAESIETLRLGGGHTPSEEELHAIDPL